MFGPLYPLLSAYPTIEAVAVFLPHWHRWHRNPDRALEDLDLQELRGEVLCFHRIVDTEGWQADNVILVDVPDELREYLLLEHHAWLHRHSFPGAPR